VAEAEAKAEAKENEAKVLTRPKRMSLMRHRLRRRIEVPAHKAGQQEGGL
jgi:hypothetical protein